LALEYEGDVGMAEGPNKPLQLSQATVQR